MKYFFLNTQSCSGLALKKWSKVSHSLPDLQGAHIVENFFDIHWENFQVLSGDTFISAGGDGTLHCMVNALVKNKGVDVLSKIKVGHVGLGSNNSFLRPYSECKIIHDVPMRIANETYAQDLMEVEVTLNGNIQKVYCVANSSVGFLATANILFNTARDIAVLKKWNSDLADVYTFIKALINWRAIEVEYITNEKSEIKSITNMHFMKKPYYATDLGFPEIIPSNNGLFRLNILWERPRLVILKKFFSMLVFKNLLQGRDMTAEVSSITIKSKKSIPIELDGEIYFGTEFKIKAFKEGIHLCK